MNTETYHWEYVGPSMEDGERAANVAGEYMLRRGPRTLADWRAEALADAIAEWIWDDAEIVSRMSDELGDETRLIDALTTRYSARIRACLTMRFTLVEPPNMWL